MSTEPDRGSSAGDVTEILADVQQGREGAIDDLFRAVYGELRGLAGGYMAGQRADHTLQPTALVNEAYLKLLGGAGGSWEDRSHFLHTAARAMRQILVDHARTRGARKRGGDAVRVTLRETTHGTLDPGVEVLAVHEAMRTLESVDPRKATVVELRYFAGLDLEETAQVMGVNERTVRRLWDRARAWLYREMDA